MKTTVSCHIGQRSSYVRGVYMPAILVLTILCTILPHTLRASSVHVVELIPLYDEGSRFLAGDGKLMIGVPPDYSKGAYWSAATGIVSLGEEWFPIAISRDASAIVGRPSSGRSYGFLWSQSHGLSTFDDEVNITGHFPWVISGDGNVVFGGMCWEPNHREYVYRWTTAGGFERLGEPCWHKMYCTNTDGTLAAGENWMWTRTGGWRLLPMWPNLDEATVRDMTPDGSVMVGRMDRQAVRWTAEGIEDLGIRGEAQSVSADGSVIVGVIFPDRYQLFIWRQGEVVRDLEDYLEIDLGIDLTAWDLRGLVNLSDDATVIAAFAVEEATQAECMLVIKMDVDTDGDGLLDTWETEGLDINEDGTVDLDLPALGADVDHKDLFVEVDRMVGVPFSRDALDIVRTAFANAPINNPDGLPGIDLHIQVDDTVPFQETIDDGFADLNNIKATYWGTAAERTPSPNRDHVLTAKKRAFRYCLFANKFAPSNAVGLAEMPGNDLSVAFGGIPAAERTDHEMAVTFMHELGHNLGLNEGGGDAILFKPNHVSVMNYGFTEFQEDSTGDLLSPDYSREVMPSLDESNLDENVGIVSAVTPDVLTFYGLTDPNGVHQGIQRVPLNTQPFDWNNNLDFSETGVALDLNWLYPSDPGYNPPTPGQLLNGHDDWANLELPIGTTGAFADRVVANLEPVPMTVEVRQWLREQVPHIPMLADLNDDRRIDMEDFAAFAAYWQEEDCGDCGNADFTDDDSVTILDLSILAQRWLIGIK